LYPPLIEGDDKVCSGKAEADMMGDEDDRAVSDERALEAFRQDVLSRMRVDRREDVVKKDRLGSRVDTPGEI
jgi:hypothetical protein